MIDAARQGPTGGHVVVILLFAIVAGLSGLLTVPPLDRDESRFIQATTQMIETGDYVTIRFQDDERNKKPIGVYWLQAASVQAFADVEDRPLWAYRLPSLIAAALAGLFTYIAGAALFGRQAGFYAGILLTAAPVVMAEASIAKTDASLLAAVAGMQAALVWALVHDGPRTPWRPLLLFYGALAVGILLKGPIAPMVAGATLAGLFVFPPEGTSRGALWRRLRPILGGVVVLVLVLPWFIAVGIATEGRFYAEALGIDMFGKLGTSQESHRGPPGYHFAVFWAMFWPASLFVLAALRHAVPRWREGVVLFCLAWIVPVWALFEFSATKLPHYTMVTYPAIAILAGWLIAKVPETAHRRLRLAGAGIYVVVGIGATVAMMTIADRYSSAGLGIWHYLGAAIVCVATLVAGVLVWRKQSARAVAAVAAASALFAWGAFEGVLPDLDRLALTPRLGDMLDDNDAHPLEDNKGPVALVGYSEPSAIFTFGTDTQLLEPDEAAIWLRRGRDRAAVVEAAEVDAFLAGFDDPDTVEEVASIDGFNYSNNRDVRLTLFRMPASPRTERE